jgi:drug/metabolite transporter (DMT)-like permease
MGTSEEPLVTLTYTALVGLVVTSVVVPFVWVSPTPTEFCLSVITGLLYTLVQGLVVLAHKHSKASGLATLSYTQLIWSTLLGYLAFNSLPDYWTILGAITVMMSGLYASRYDR